MEVVSQFSPSPTFSKYCRKEIKIEDNIACIIITSYDNQWIVDYEDNLTSHIDYAAPELIDALYQLLCWTIKNHFFKNK